MFQKFCSWVISKETIVQGRMSMTTNKNEKFNVVTEMDERACTVFLSGEMDLSVAPEFRLVMEPLVGEAEQDLIINMKDLKYIDSTGIGKELDNKEETQLRKYAESIIIKDVKSPERLLDETTLFLHRVEADLPEDKRRILQKLHNKETLFEGKRILLVDDDVRNVFALSSVLEGYRMDVTFAENGREAIELLQQDDFDLVLMDMMMPEMDGYEAMRIIRQIPAYEKLPIIALTAKAMKDDRAKCIEAGASDYVKKPIQTDQLLSLMRVWLYS